MYRYFYDVGICLNWYPELGYNASFNASIAASLVELWACHKNFALYKSGIIQTLRDSSDYELRDVSGNRSGKIAYNYKETYYLSFGGGLYEE